MKTLFFPRLLIAGLALCAFAGCDNSDSDSDIEYVALGASDATGFGAQPLTNGYVYLIEDRIQERGTSVELTNLGIPGAEISEIEDIELREAIRENPDLITLFTGANDLIDGDSPVTFEEDLRDLLRKLTEETKSFIVIANIPDLTRVERFSDGSDLNVTSARLQQFNQAISRAAAAYSIPVVNLATFDAGDYTADDGFHPNDGGHRIIADAFLSVIEPQFFGDDQ